MSTDLQRRVPMLVDEYWTKMEEDATETVMSLDELADVAITILKRMAATGKEIVQLCGPMTTGGFEDSAKNFLYFEKCIKVADAHGLLVFNQLPFQKAMHRLYGDRPGNVYWMEILTVFYKKIFESGLVKIAYFLPLWETSKGATWEFDLVSKLPIVVKPFPIEWSREAMQLMPAGTFYP